MKLFEILTSGSVENRKSQSTDKSLLQLVNTPVVFVHGNSDAALRVNYQFSGWEDSVLFFEANGYTSVSRAENIMNQMG